MNTHLKGALICRHPFFRPNWAALRQTLSFACERRIADFDPKMVYRGGCGSVSNDERASPSGTMIGSRSA
jgi:hypothetical protein